MVWTKVEPAPEIEPVAQETLTAMVVVVLFELLLLPQAPATSAIIAIIAISAAGTARCRLRVRLVSVIGFMGRTVREPGGAGAPTRETGGEQRANLGVARGT